MLIILALTCATLISKGCYGADLPSHGTTVQFILERLVVLEEKAGEYEERIRFLEKSLENKDREIADLERTVQKQTLDIEYLQKADENRLILKSKSKPNSERHNKGLTNRNIRSIWYPISDAVAFYAYMSANEINPSRHHVIIFDVAVTNEGNGYNPNLGAFIAPVDGMYAFNWNIIAHENNHIFTELAVNSQSIGNAFADSGNHSDVSYSSVTLVKRLNAGDTVLIRTPAESKLASRGNIVSFYGGRSTFCGWRIF